MPEAEVEHDVTWNLMVTARSDPSPDGDMEQIIAARSDPEQKVDMEHDVAARMADASLADADVAHAPMADADVADGTGCCCRDGMAGACKVCAMHFARFVALCNRVPAMPGHAQKPCHLPHRPVSTCATYT